MIYSISFGVYRFVCLLVGLAHNLITSKTMKVWNESYSSMLLTKDDIDRVYF